MDKLLDDLLVCVQVADKDCQRFTPEYQKWFKEWLTKARKSLLMLKIKTYGGGKLGMRDAIVMAQYYPLLIEYKPQVPGLTQQDLSDLFAGL